VRRAVLGYVTVVSSAAERPPDTDSAHVELARGSDDRWRWSYRAGDLELTGNDSFPDADAARQAANAAYPGIEVRVVTVDPPAPPRAPRPRGREGLLILLLAAVLVALIALVRRRPAGSS
jgi:hypothetical protein